MKVLIVGCHPEPKSFNSSLLEAAHGTIERAGHQAQLIDLYREGFDPRASCGNYLEQANPDRFDQQAEERYASTGGGFSRQIEGCIRAVLSADLLILQFPLWWFGMPAMLKGWIDQVFVSGRLYGGGRQFSCGVQQGRKALLSLTTGAAESSFSSEALGEMEQILYPIHRGILEFVGYQVLPSQVIYAPHQLGDRERQQAIVNYQSYLSGLLSRN